MKKLDEILGELERVLMNTYKSDGCVTSAITEIHKDQAISQILKWVREQLPKKKESEHLGCQQFDENYCFKHENCFDEDEEGMHPLSKQGFNQAIDKTKEIFK